MAARGLNGASTVTLNARFIKCGGCNVNIPKEDMLALGKCTVCGRPYETEKTTMDGVNAECVVFQPGEEAAAAVDTAPPAKKQRKRWAVLVSKRGKTYYHNTETGEDRWTAPPDLDADAADDPFVPFKNDAVKNAVLREHAKQEAVKLGVPMEVITAAQRQQMQQEAGADPFAPPKPVQAVAPSPPASLSSSSGTHQHAAAEDQEAEEEPPSSQDGSKCILM